MKIQVQNYMVFILCFAFIQNINSQKTIKTTLIHDQLTRSFSFYIPASYTSGNLSALVFNLHGYSSNADQQEFYGDFRKIADTAGFIIVHPNGTIFPQSGQQFWNVGLVGNSNVDDVGFLHAIIDTLSTAYSIDENRIFSTGMSNGGFMSYHLACVSDRFAAIASVTGSMTALTQALCKNAKPIPVMEIHGTADGVVNYDGSTGILSIPDVLDFWIQKNGLNAHAVIKTDVPNVNTTDGATAEHYYYPGNHEVEHYKVLNGGHTWPGTPFVIGTTCQDFSASQVIWNFFNKHKRQTVNSEQTDKSTMRLHPNPANEKLHIDFKEFSKRPGTIIIRNSVGIPIFEHLIKEDQFALDIRWIPSGLYFIQCLSGKNSFYSSFIKI
ncbi:MAG: prolyl oligopeptidase family serine peptidase [Saprospiraceae bacterium]|nr:prolyl oligopeptidase family serine peptidase [Saprospiraceae bacterium]